MFGHTRFPKKKKQENIGKRIFDKYSYESGYSFETGYFSGNLGAKLGPTKYQKTCGRGYYENPDVLGKNVSVFY